MHERQGGLARESGRAALAVMTSSQCEPSKTPGDIADRDTPLLRNRWYVAARAGEVGRGIPLLRQFAKMAADERQEA